MSWFRRKSGSDDGTSTDPSIEFARRVLQNPGGTQKRPDSQKDGPDTAPPPSGTDSTFCYGEEANPCA